jgi:cytochrome b561
MTNMLEETIPIYDRRTRQFHWLVAGTIAFMYAMAQLNSLLPKGPLRLGIWSFHVLVGFTLAALVVGRIGWRLTQGDRLPPLEGGLRHVAAVAVHYLLYLLMIAVVVLGIANVFGHGFPLFGLWKFPRFWDKPVQHWIAETHGLVANIIAGVAVFHAVAALYHHRVLKDATLHRMWPHRLR